MTSHRDGIGLVSFRAHGIAAEVEVGHEQLRPVYGTGYSLARPGGLSLAVVNA
jgi:hypothetical protein